MNRRRYFYLRKIGRADEAIDYTPIDEWETKPLTRVLRALMHRSWVDTESLYDGFELESKTEQDRYFQAVAQGVRRGYLERRGQRGWFEYRLTAAGRAELLRRLNPDTAELDAPARPGTEHLLCG